MTAKSRSVRSVVPHLLPSLVKPSGQSVWQSWNVLLSEQCWPVSAFPCSVWYLEVRPKICSVPAIGSVLNTAGLEGSCGGPVSSCWVSVGGSRWTPVICFSKCLLEASQVLHQPDWGGVIPDLWPGAVWSRSCISQQPRSPSRGAGQLH